MKKLPVLFAVLFATVLLSASCGLFPSAQTEVQSHTDESFATTEMTTQTTAKATSAPEASTVTVQTTRISAVVTKTETTKTLATSSAKATTSTTATTTQATEPVDDGYVHYRDFGAKGDGKTDDFPAIAAAHSYANEQGLPVRAEEGATYYIGPSSSAKYVEIKTDTVWTGAKFIIDDSCIEEVNSVRTAPVFRVMSSLKSYTVTSITKLSETETKLDTAPGCDSLAYIEDSKERVYIRTGIHESKGQYKREVVLIDENGNISERTPLTWSYSAISAITVYPIDTKTLTITGGEFTTINNVYKNLCSYIYRGIEVNRSNTVLQGITQTIVGEGDPTVGCTHNGFIYINKAAYVDVKNCCVAPYLISPAYVNGMAWSMGYGITVCNSTDVTFSDCTQTVSIDDSSYWGVFASNYSRNITMERCVLSRFDAHCGVYNVTIRDCELGYQGIRFVGFGTATIENTSVHSDHFILLRSDYGSSWKGDIIIKNCTLTLLNGYSGSSIIGGSNTCKHDYGYSCYCPTVYIDGLYVDDSIHTSGYKGIAVLPNYVSNIYISLKPRWQYIEPQALHTKQITTKSGCEVKLCHNSLLYGEIVWDKE